MPATKLSFNTLCLNAAEAFGDPRQYERGIRGTTAEGVQP